MPRRGDGKIITLESSAPLAADLQAAEARKNAEHVKLLQELTNRLDDVVIEFVREHPEMLLAVVCAGAFVSGKARLIFVHGGGDPDAAEEWARIGLKSGAEQAAALIARTADVQRQRDAKAETEASGDEQDVEG